MSVDNARTGMPVLTVNGQASWDSEAECPDCGQQDYDRTPGPFALSHRGSDAALCESCADQTWSGAWEVVNAFNSIQQGLDRAEPAGRLVLLLLMDEIREQMAAAALQVKP